MNIQSSTVDPMRQGLDPSGRRTIVKIDTVKAI